MNRKKNVKLQKSKLSLHIMANTLNFEIPERLQYQFTVIAEDKI